MTSVVKCGWCGLDLFEFDEPLRFEVGCDPTSQLRALPGIPEVQPGERAACGRGHSWIEPHGIEGVYIYPKGSVVSHKGLRNRMNLGDMTRSMQTTPPLTQTPCYLPFPGRLE